MKRLSILLVVASLFLGACDLEEIFDFFLIKDLTHADDPAVRAAAASDAEGRADIKAEQAIETAVETRDPADAADAERLRPGEARYPAYNAVLLGLQGNTEAMTAAVGRLLDILVYDNPGADELTIRRLAQQQVLDAQKAIIFSQDDFPGRPGLVHSYCGWIIFELRGRYGASAPAEVEQYISNHGAYWIC